MLWIPAEATDREETHAGAQKSLLKTKRKEDSGLQLSADGIREKPTTDGHETLTPPGISTPDITAPDGGTTRGRPAGSVAAMRSVSLMTAVYYILRLEQLSSPTSEHTCQVRKLLEYFVTRSLVEDWPRGANLVHQPLLYLRIAQYMIDTGHERCPDGVRSCCK